MSKNMWGLEDAVSTSTRHSSGSLALKEFRVCSLNCSILLQTAVQFHMEPILILLLHGSTLSILGPFLCSFTQKGKKLFTLFLNSIFSDLTTLFNPYFYIICDQTGAHLHQRKRHTSPEEDELAAGTAE